MCTRAGKMGRELLIHSTKNSKFRQAIAVEAGQAKIDRINILRKMAVIESKHKVVGFDVLVDYSMSVQIFKCI
jgi:dihydrodipicolinate reductase